MSKYPFSPELLDALPEELAELYRGLEDTLLMEICSRLKLRDELNEVTVQDIRALRSHGIDLKDIEKAIRKTTGISEKKLKELLDDVVDRNQKYYTDLIDLAQITQPETLVSIEDTWAIYEQTKQTMRNLTRSMGFLVDAGRTMLPPARVYQWALDNATMQIQSGAISYNQAIKSAVRQLAQSGLKVVDYESGVHRQIDSAVRTAVMTGVNQICAKYTEQSAEWLETPYFEVSAHSGARDKPGPSPWSSHKEWQGRVYSVRTGDIYPSIYEVCGLGAVDGLEGANCRHRRFPWVEGVSERTYTDKQLEHIDDGLGCTYDGKTYTAYEATQMQRRVEREIRKLKREKAAYKAAGLHEDETAVSIRLRRLNSKYKAFSAAAGLPEQPERMKVLHTKPKAYEPPTNRLITQPKTGGFSDSRCIDVTELWRKDATPNSHAVQGLRSFTINGATYTVDGHNVVLDYSAHEKEIAELLEREFGGELYMVPRVNNPQGISTPDYLFRGKGYDLKTLSKEAGENTIINRIKKARKQSKNFILDLTNAKKITDSVLKSQIQRIYKDKETAFVDTIIVIRNGNIVVVVKKA